MRKNILKDKNDYKVKGIVCGMSKRGAMGFAAFVCVVLSLSFVAAFQEPISKGPPVDLLPGPTTATSIFKLYDFVREIDIEAYQCRIGPYPTEFPDEISPEECNREFLEITSDDM